MGVAVGAGVGGVVAVGSSVEVGRGSIVGLGVGCAVDVQAAINAAAIAIAVIAHLNAKLATIGVRKTGYKLW